MKNKHSQFGPAALRRELEAHAPLAERWVVGYSGGLDSTALLAALHALGLPQAIVAVHVNHGLSPFADSWQAHCQEQCAGWGIECRVRRVSVQNSGFGIEDAAREARYQAYRQELEVGDVLLLGHHEDDQAETLLFRLLRGAGPRGLGGIVRERTFGPATILRPLLQYPRAALERYVSASALPWVSDESNEDGRYDRNYLRRHIMPLLAKRWPGFSQRWRLTAEACQAADRLSLDLARIDLQHCDERPERWGWSIDRASYLELANYRQENLLRYWALDRQLAPMDRAALAEIKRQFLHKPDPSSSACVGWAGAELRYYGARLYLSAALPDFIPDKALRLGRSTRLPGGGVLEMKQLHQIEESQSGLRPSDKLEVRWRRGGERCRPLGRSHSQTLKKLLQEYKLEPWLRDRVPLIYADGELAAVADLWICEGSQPQAGESALGLEWRLSGAAQ